MACTRRFPSTGFPLVCFVFNCSLVCQDGHLNVFVLALRGCERLVFDPKRLVVVRLAGNALIEVGWPVRGDLPPNRPSHPPESKLRRRSGLEAANGGLGPDGNLPLVRPTSTRLALKSSGFNVGHLGQRMQPVVAASRGCLDEGSSPSIELLPVHLPHGIGQGSTGLARGQEAVDHSIVMPLLPRNSGK